MLRGDRGRADDHLGAVRLEHVALVLADLVGADEDAAVALRLGHHRQPDAGVAGGRLDDRAARLQLAGGLGGLDHPGRDAVLHGAAGVEVLDLREHQRAASPPPSRRSVERARAEPQQRGVADQVQERVRRTASANLEPGVRLTRTGAGVAALRRVEAWARPQPHASSPPPPRTAGAASPCSGGRSTACCAPRPKLARRTIGEPRDEPPPDATGWYGRGRPGPAIKIALLGDSSAAGLRRATGSRRRPGALLASGARRAGATAGSTCAAFAVVGAQSVRPRRPGRPGAADRARRRGHPDRRQRRDPPVLPAQSVRHLVRGRPPAARGRRRGRRRHLPRPRHDQADRAAAAAGRPRLVAPAGGRADDRGRRGRRPHRLARLDPRPEFAAAPGAAVRARPVPPVGRRLPLAGRRCCSPRRWPRSAWPRGRGRARGLPRRGRAADRRRRRPGRRHARHRARRHRGRRPAPRRPRPLGRAAAPPPASRRPAPRRRPPPRTASEAPGDGREQAQG